MELDLALNGHDAVAGLVALFSSPRCSLDMSQEDETQIADLSGLADEPDDVNFRALEAAYEQDEEKMQILQEVPVPEFEKLGLFRCAGPEVPGESSSNTSDNSVGGARAARARWAKKISIVCPHGFGANLKMLYIWCFEKNFTDRVLQFILHR